MRTVEKMPPPSLVAIASATPLRFILVPVTIIWRTPAEVALSTSSSSSPSAQSVRLQPMSTSAWGGGPEVNWGRYWKLCATGAQQQFPLHHDLDVQSRVCSVVSTISHLGGAEAASTGGAPEYA